MAMYGRVEVQSWQVTPMGVQRLQTGTLKGVGLPERQVFAQLVELGGGADTDELTVGGQISPGIIGTSLRRLADLGLIAPVVPSTTASPSVR